MGIRFYCAFHFYIHLLFQLNEETGEISVGPEGLDRELMESFELLIEVVDGGKRESGRGGSSYQLNWNSVNTRNTAQTTVQINIQDENDNPPKFIFPKSDSPVSYISTF